MAPERNPAHSMIRWFIQIEMRALQDERRDNKNGRAHSAGKARLGSRPDLVVQQGAGVENLQLVGDDDDLVHVVVAVVDLFKAN